MDDNGVQTDPKATDSNPIGVSDEFELCETTPGNNHDPATTATDEIRQRQTSQVESTLPSGQRYSTRSRSNATASGTVYAQPESIDEIANRRQMQVKIVCNNLNLDIHDVPGILAEVFSGCLEELVSSSRLASVLTAEANLGAVEIADLKARFGGCDWAKGLIWEVFGPHQGHPHQVEERLVPVVVVLKPNSGVLQVQLPQGYRTSANSVAEVRNGKLIVQVDLEKE